MFLTGKNNAKDVYKRLHISLCRMNDEKKYDVVVCCSMVVFLFCFFLVVSEKTGEILK